MVEEHGRQGSGGGVAVVFGLIVLLLLGGGIAVSFMPTRHVVTFSFESPSNAARVYINDEYVGDTPLSMSLEELAARFDPALMPASWPPPGASPSTSMNMGGVQFDVFTKEPPAEDPKGEFLYYVRQAHSKNDVLGGLRLRVEYPSGRRGDLVGGGGSSSGGFRTTTTEEQVVFMEQLGN